MTARPADDCQQNADVALMQSYRTVNRNKTHKAQLEFEIK